MRTKTSGRRSRRACSASEERFAELLRSIVEVARAIFAARASSIFLLDEETDELVFAAVAGEGESTLVGKRSPSTRDRRLGSRAANAARDRGRAARPAASRATSPRATGYVPKGLMAVPLLHDERSLGVLRSSTGRSDRGSRSQEMELLGLFGTQAAVALDLVESARRARAALEGTGDAVAVARVATALDGLEGTRRDDALALLAALERVLAP